jgi:hypothetical protein
MQVCLKSLEERIRWYLRIYASTLCLDRHCLPVQLVAASPTIEKGYYDRSIVVDSEVEMVAAEGQEASSGMRA